MKPFTEGFEKDKRKERKYFYLSCLPIFLVLTGIIFYACIPSQRLNKINQHPSKFSYSPVSFVPPKPERIVLSNGMIVYLLEDHEVPLITIHSLIKTGGICIPPGNL